MPKNTNNGDVSDSEDYEVDPDDYVVYQDDDYDVEPNDIASFISDEIAKHLEKGQVLSSYDARGAGDLWSLVAEFVDPWMEGPNEELRGMTDQEANRYVRGLIDYEVDQGRVYKYKDWQSYLNNVRSRGLISSNEAYISEQIRKERAEGETGEGYRCSEFPIDGDGFFTGPAE